MYQVEPDATVAEQIDALPYDALIGYAAALGVMKLAPWGGRSINEANPDAEVRQLVFGTDGAGLVTYLVMEREWRVGLVWSGIAPVSRLTWLRVVVWVLVGLPRGARGIPLLTPAYGRLTSTAPVRGDRPT